MSFFNPLLQPGNLKIECLAILVGVVENEVTRGDGRCGRLLVKVGSEQRVVGKLGEIVEAQLNIGEPKDSKSCDSNQEHQDEAEAR
ncbi:MAG TPA: hypothetical protein VFO41_10620 [Alphaproteobacteria bacterium]|nr:hypothetical protein [Alphaproteobacteria bacterium]